MTSTAVAPAEVGVEVGTFFYSSWGYDQTNVDFYKVIALTPKGVKVQKWSSRIVDDNGPITHVVPGDEPATYTDWSACTPGMDHWEEQAAKIVKPAPVVTKRLRSYTPGKASFHLTSYASGYQWDGTPKYATGSGYGH
jgi:hypothetical protein